VSNVSRGRRNRNNKKYIIIIALVLISLVVWYFSSGGKKNKPQNKNNDRISTSVDKTRKLSTTNKKANSRKSNLTEADLTGTKVARKVAFPNKQYSKLQKELKRALKSFKEEEYVDARNIALKIVESTLREGDKLWEQAVGILNESNIAIYMTDMPAPEKKLYTIQEGDSLNRIAKKYHTTVEAVQKSNGLNPASPIIFPGKTLYIFQGDWSIKVSKSKFRLYLYNGNHLFKVYNVGVGRQGRTPEGSFVINAKQKHPTWYNEGKAIPYGSKENVLGTRWMALKPVGGTDQHLRGYGIHGTWLPETIGTKSSNGCIRMKNDDVNELFSIVPYKTKVLIEK